MRTFRTILILLLGAGVLGTVAADETIYPAVVRQRRDPRDGFVTQPQMVGKVDSLRLRRSRPTSLLVGNQWDYAPDSELTCAIDVRNKQQNHCADLRYCSKGFATFNSTHVVLRPRNPGSYQCRIPTQQNKSLTVYVIPTLVVEINRPFSISLDFVRVPLRFPTNEFFDEDDQVGVSVQAGVPYLSGLFSHAGNRSYAMDFLRGDQGNTSVLESTIMVRVVAEERPAAAASADCCTEVKLVLEHSNISSAGNSRLRLLDRMNALRCAAQLLNTEADQLREIKMYPSSNSISMYTLVSKTTQERRRCAAIQRAAADGLATQCVHHKFTFASALDVATSHMCLPMTTSSSSSESPASEGSEEGKTTDHQSHPKSTTTSSDTDLSTETTTTTPLTNTTVVPHDSSISQNPVPDDLEEPGVSSTGGDAVTTTTTTAATGGVNGYPTTIKPTAEDEENDGTSTFSTTTTSHRPPTTGADDDNNSSDAKQDAIVIRRTLLIAVVAGFLAILLFVVFVVCYKTYSDYDEDY